MQTYTKPSVQYLFKKHTAIGTIYIYPLVLPENAVTIHNWVNQPYAKFWDMQNTTLEQVFDAYQEIVDDNNSNAYLGVLNEQPVFLCESYSVIHSEIANFYQARVTDFGMHILVAPAEKKISKFTWYIFTTVMDFFFEALHAKNVVVEPDVNNDKIHVLNKKAGFEYIKEIQLPNKKAHLAICSRENYQKLPYKS